MRRQKKRDCAPPDTSASPPARTLSRSLAASRDGFVSKTGHLSKIGKISCKWMMSPSLVAQFFSLSSKSLGKFTIFVRKWEIFGRHHVVAMAKPTNGLIEKLCQAGVSIPKSPNGASPSSRFCFLSVRLFTTQTTTWNKSLCEY